MNMGVIMILQLHRLILLLEVIVAIQVLMVMKPILFWCWKFGKDRHWWKKFKDRVKRIGKWFSEV